jgi:hypothetical protein
LIPTYRRLKLDPYHSPYTKINRKWIKDLNLRHETLKLLKEKIGGTPKDIGTFLNRTPKA